MEFSILYCLAQSSFLLLVVTLLSISLKIYFLKIIIPSGLRRPTIQKPYLFLIGTLTGALFSDIAWIVKTSQELFFFNTSYAFVTFFIRIAWGFLIIQYQSLALFIQSLVEKKFTFNCIQKIFICISSSVSLYFFSLALFSSNLNSAEERFSAKITMVPSFEIFMMRSVIFYLLTIFIGPSLFFIFKRIKIKHLPKILKKQIKIFTIYLICPYLLMETIQMCYFMVHIREHYLCTIMICSTLLFSYSIYYCLNKVLGLRFLNNTYSIEKISPFDPFKSITNNLNSATSLQEVKHIIGTFFKNNFNIAPSKVQLHPLTLLPSKKEMLENPVEHFIYTNNDLFKSWIRKFKILVHDDIVFSNFYEESEIYSKFAHFLESLNADIFIPLYNERKMIAYLIIEYNALGSECYTQEMYDKIIFFANHIGPVVYVLQNKDHETFMHKQQMYKQELHLKEQLLTLYQESVRFFLCHPKHNNIGIIFYKNGRFSFGNQIASEMIALNLNFHDGHDITKICTQIAEYAQQYRSPQTVSSYDIHNNQIILTAVPHLEQNSVIITATYPDIADIIKPHINYLDDLNKRDYLLYLHTTHYGNLINEYIPDSCEKFLNIKLTLLSIALNIQATLIDVPDGDNQAVVELLHYMSGRKVIHTIDMQKFPPENIGLELFGYASDHSPLLEKLHGATLYIKNIHLIPHDIQEYITDYLHFGQLRILKSEYRIPTDVRIICSTPQNLYKLVQEQVFSSSLYQELQKNNLYIPSLNSLEQSELFHLIDGFTQQLVKTSDFKNMFILSEKEKYSIIEKNPVSILELKTKIQHILTQKSKKNNLSTGIKFDPAYITTNPELAQAARLGKQALKDTQIMLMLWKRFKNQSRIADFLGVSRSTVCKRLKEII